MSADRPRSARQDGRSAGRPKFGVRIKAEPHLAIVVGQGIAEAFAEVVEIGLIGVLGRAVVQCRSVLVPRSLQTLFQRCRFGAVVLGFGNDRAEQEDGDSQRSQSKR